MGLELGAVIDGKYEIVRLLGEGGMGAVYEGNNTRIHRRVAIKVLHGNAAGNEEAVTRFEREAQAAGRIGSEHIVEVLDLGDLPGGDRYMVMEFLEGEALNDRISRGRMNPRVVAQMMVEMLEGLKAAHAAGIVHRDLKPDNVFLLANRGGKKDFVKIVDFGISKFNVVGGEFSMTRTGAVMGTPYYMAPEQAKGGKEVDHRVDLYAVGVILYQAVVGRVPFDAETFNELLFKIVLETPPSLAEQVEGIDPSFVEIVDRAMAREPSARYQTAEEFQKALQRWLGGSYIPIGDTMGVGTPEGLDRTALPQPGISMATPQGGLSPSGGKTQDAWANTGAGVAEALPVKKSPNWAVIGAAVVAVALIGGIGVTLAGKSEDTGAAAAEQAAAEEAALKAEQERAAMIAELKEEKAKAEEARLKAEAARAEAEKNKADVEAQARAAQAAREAEEKEAAAQAAASRVQARPRPAPRPAPQPAAAPAPAPAPAPGPKPGSAAGRPIRTDF